MTREQMPWVRVAAEVRAERDRVQRLGDELIAAPALEPETGRLALYGVAALLESFYTGVERALSRVAVAMGGLPGGANWHRSLLEDSVLVLPKLRPQVLRATTAAQLDRYLGFRHRFRNLYLFDLDPSQLEVLRQDLPGVWAEVSRDLEQFAQTLETMANA